MLRVLVLACELWLGAVYLLVLVAGARLRAGWLPRAVVGLGAAMLLGLAALDPEAFIVERNVERYAASAQLDLQYLSRLSADAVPALASLPVPERVCALQDLEYELKASDDRWREWNWSRERAREVLAAQPTVACDWYRW